MIWKVGDKRCRAGEEEFVPVCFFSHPAFEAETSAESHEQLSSAIPHHCQATLLSSGALTAEEINQAIKNGENLGKSAKSQTFQE